MFTFNCVLVLVILKTYYCCLQRQYLRAALNLSPLSTLLNQYHIMIATLVVGPPIATAKKLNVKRGSSVRDPLTMSYMYTSIWWILLMWCLQRLLIHQI